MRSEPPLGAVGRLLESPGELELFEEEVPRDGATVTRSYQYARWIDGSTHLWVGRRKRPGRGEASSGLRFDAVDAVTAADPLVYTAFEPTLYTGPDRTTALPLHAAPGGQAAYVVWSIRNTGTQTWRRERPGAVSLGTWSPADRTSRLAMPSWVAPTRPGAVIEEAVGPGGLATFAFEIRLPKAAGPFEERFNLVVDEGAWFPGDGIAIRGHVAS